MLKEERVDEILAALGNDQLHIKALAEMSSEDASAQLKKEGFEVSADELIEFGEYFRALAEKHPGHAGGSVELDENGLENVNGGAGIMLLMLYVFSQYNPVILPRWRR